jgi:hypothetical protein
MGAGRMPHKLLPRAKLAGRAEGQTARAEVPEVLPRRTA